MAEANKELITVLNLTSIGIGSLSKALYQKNGRKALPIIAKVMSQIGVEWGKLIQQTLPIKSMKAYVEQRNMFNSKTELGMEIVEVTDDTWHIKMSHCPFGLEGTSKELCEAMMTVDEKKMSICMEQVVSLKILKSIAAGDKQCEFIFSKK
jgi:predicted hydrocarbon binding protein